MYSPQQSRSFLTRNSAGYTLMELLVVLALVALSASLVVPFTLHSYANLKLRLAAGSLATLLQQARSRARYQGQTEQVVFAAPGPRERKLLLVGEDGKPSGETTLPAGIALITRRGSGEWTDRPEPLHFFPDGTSEAMQIDLHDAQTRRIRLELVPFAAKPRVSTLNKGDE